MLASVFLKTIRDRWRGWFMAFVSLAALLLLAMWAYQSIDLSIYTSLPEAFRSILGIPETADAGSLAIKALIASYGAMTIAAMALAMGAAAIAGEEREGTIGLLLANPKSRTHLLVSKAAAMVLLTGLCVLALLGAVFLSAHVLNVSIAGLDVGALSLHLFFNSLFYGFLALATGAWTGNRSNAIGVAVGLMVIAFFAVGILPLVEGAEEFVKASPWHYFDGSDPLLNGIDWGHLAVLFATTALFAAAAIIGVNRRDLKGQSVGISLLDRLRSHPLTNKLVGRLAGSARVSAIWLKTASEYQALLLITAAYTFLVQGLLIGPLYAAMPPEAFAILGDSGSGFPQAFLSIIGGGDLGTAEGFYQTETFGLMGPIVVMIVAVAIGAGAMAGEEAGRTMGLLLANPIPRSRVVLEKTGTMVLFSFVIGFATFAGVALGSVLGDLGMNIGYIAVTCLLQTLVGLVFGALALALGAATGRRNVAIFGAIGAGLSLHLLNGFAAFNETMAGLAKWSPFYYYLGNDPLNNGMDWGNAAVLATICVVLIGASFVLFQRRDLRQTG